ncbi:extracellular calcium-sensing receptor-like [Protopterus annectens]|uniref:extracellular calcium-sensing receptor-like n=1 Tax=Protopterus annectens TaxID=7888 RepID=UPI001CFC2CF4|nr:extracellular calcium-sensing receptor-like [Protopterus annectens]
MSRRDAVPAFEHYGCKLGRDNIKGYIKKGDIVLGGTFPVHDIREAPVIFYTEEPQYLPCETFYLNIYQLIQAMIFAISEVNDNPHILPNVSIGFWIYDTCDTVAGALEGTMLILSGQEKLVPNFNCHVSQPVVAILGDDKSQMSIPMARLLGLHKLPQISYAATVSALSDKYQFPSFLRTAPSDHFQSVGLARLVIHFGWTWVGILLENSDYGEMGGQILREKIIKAGGCVEFYELIPLVYSYIKIQNIIEVIKKSSADVIVIFSSHESLLPVMEEIVKHGISGKVWIASEAWSDSPFFSNRKFLNTLQGTLGFSIRRGQMPRFRDFLYGIHPSKLPADIFVKTFWEQVFGCIWLDNNTEHMTQNVSGQGSYCSGQERLQDTNIRFFQLTDLRFTYNVYNAVFITVHALHNMLSCKPGEGPFMNGTCGKIDKFKPWQLLHYITRVHFKDTMGDTVVFDENGDPPAIYDIINWQVNTDDTFSYIEVGRFNSMAPKGQDLIINMSRILWNEAFPQIPSSVCSEKCLPGYRKAPQLGQPICCFDCIPCSEGSMSNESDSLDCLQCPEDQWTDVHQANCIYKTLEFLSYDDILGAVLATVSLGAALFTTAILFIFIRHHKTPIVKANNSELSYFLLVSLLLCFFCPLIFIGYPTNLTCILRQMAFGLIIAFCVSCVLAKTVMVVIAFNATKPNSSLRKLVGSKLSYSIIIACTSLQLIVCIIWLNMCPPFSVQNFRTRTGKIIVECNDGSTTAFWCMLGYMGILASVSFLVAFLSRNLPDSFNEAKYITFSMIVFVSVWLSFIPTYVSTTGKYMVAVEIFAIVSSGIGLLSCIFFPKCYIILLRPHLNTREHLMGKGIQKN